MRHMLDWVHSGSVYLVTIFLCKSISVSSFLVQMSLAPGIWGMGEGLKKLKILQLNWILRKMDTKVRLRIKKLIPRAAAQWKRPRLQQNIFLMVVLLYKKKPVVIESDDRRKMLWKLNIAKFCQWFIVYVFWLLLSHCSASLHKTVAWQTLVMDSFQQTPASSRHWSRRICWLRSKRLHLHPAMNIFRSKLFHTLVLLQFWICV